MTNEDSQKYSLTQLERVLRKNTMQMERLLAHQVWSALDERKIVTFPYQDVEIQFYLPDGWFDLLQRLILLNRTFYEAPLLEHLRKRLPENSTIFDVGANIGNHTIFFGKLCSAKKIYAVEPIPHIRRLLEKNIEINALAQVDVIPYAFGATENSIGIEIFNPANLGSTTLSAERPGSIPVTKTGQRFCN